MNNFSFNFEDYKLFCHLFKLKMSKYENLKWFRHVTELESE